MHKNTTIQRENMEKSDIKTKELKEIIELESKIGNGSQFKAKNLQEKGDEIIIVQETVKKMESNLSSSQNNRKGKIDDYYICSCINGKWKGKKKIYQNISRSQFQRR